jgi:DNA-directed RNA polymerase alpha subunit
MSDFPPSMGKVARRELALNEIYTLQQAAQHTEKELLAIHGVGPKAVRIIKEELAKQNLSLKESP